MIRRPPRSTLSSSSAASDVYKRQVPNRITMASKLAAIPIRRGRSGTFCMSEAAFVTRRPHPGAPVRKVGNGSPPHAFPSVRAKWRKERVAAQRSYRKVMPHMIDTGLRIDVGCEFKYEVAVPIRAIFVVRPEVHHGQELLAEEWTLQPDSPYHDYRDLYGNVCRRTILPPGPSSVHYSAVVGVSNERDPYAPDAAQHL